MKGVIKYTHKNLFIIPNHVLYGHANEFTSFLAFLELRNTSHPDDAYELNTDYGRRNQKKADEVSVGVRLSDYLLTYHEQDVINFNMTPIINSSFNKHNMSWELVH